MGRAGQALGKPHGQGLTDAGRLAAAVTAVFSIAAGVIHISAAADHENLPVMMIGFIAVATAQVAVGGLLLWRRPSGLLVVGALGLMLGSVGMWLMSRTMGLPFLPGGHMEPIGFKDGITVLFELASIPGLLLMLSPELGRISLPSPRLGTQAVAFAGVASFMLFVPALVMGGGGHHSAGQMAEMGGHSHGGGDDHHGGGGDERASADGHSHGDGDGSKGGGGKGHEHGEASGSLSQSGGSGGGHDHGGGSGAGSLAQSGDGHAHGGGDGSTLHSGGGSGDGSGGGHGHGGGKKNAGGHDHGSGDKKSGDGHDHGGSGDRRKSAGGHEHGSGDEKGGGGHGHGGGEQGGGHGHGGGSGGGHGGGGHEQPDRTDPPLTGVVTKRAQAIEPKPAGTRETIKLQYGPFPSPPGHDASQVGVEFFGADGFVVSAKPSIRFADGTAVQGHTDGIHLHHAHLFRADTRSEDAADSRAGYQWVFGTGDEQTMGSFELLSRADTRGRTYGVRLSREPFLMVWMPMNMDDQEKVVYLEFEFEFVHGTQDEIELATGTRYRPLDSVLTGSTFNVPKTGGYYAWPLDAKRPQNDSLAESQFDPESFMTREPTMGATPGVGDIWVAPGDGELVGAAGHMHEGGMGVMFSNLGTEASPCADDGDRYPGTRIFYSRAYYPAGLFPTHLKMGTTQPGWRVRVRKGDRIALNGIYDTRTYAWPDQMSVVGIYYDPDVKVSDSERCKPALVNEPSASAAQAAESIPHQTARRGDNGASLFHGHGNEECVADGCNDYDAPPAPRGPHQTRITIDDFTFSAGDLKRRSLVSGFGPTMGGAPVVRRGERLEFVNLDYARHGGTRHAITSCHGPCNGPNTMTYPNSNGLFYSGPLGYVPLAETASSENQATPTWSLDTSNLQRGYHTYYCFHHRWMRGAFYVQ